MHRQAMLFISPIIPLIIVSVINWHHELTQHRLIIIILLLLWSGFTIIQIRQNWKYLALIILKYIVMMVILIYLNIFIFASYFPSFPSIIPQLFTMFVRGFLILFIIIWTFFQPVFIVIEHQYFVNNEKR